jgi:hypothetical protein
MAVGKDSNRLVKKQDLLNLTILLTLALAIGIYLIAATVVIAKDGAFYIEQAQKLTTDWHEIIGGHPVGYPFLILTAHKIAGLFRDPTSVSTWIYAAQAATLSCRVLALIPLYLLGRLFVGRQKSFWAVLILIVLPDPAEFGSDVLREWPHILFLSVGFLLLVRGGRNATWWCFGLAGLAAGLGYMIRPECAQLVIYGTLWLLICLFRPKPQMSRPALIRASCLLLIGFAVPFAAYAKAGGRVLPPKLRALISSDLRAPSETKPQREPENMGEQCQEAGPAGDIGQAMWRLTEAVGEDLMYFFLPALLVGVYSRFRKKSGIMPEERFYVTALVILNVLMMVLLYSNYGYISRRHSLPLVAFTIFYVPAGLQILAAWLGNLLSRGDRKPPPAESGASPLFCVLLAAGLLVCLPKLVRPIRLDKQGYIEAANWLKNNTRENDIIIVPDKRISLYAQRNGYLEPGGALKRAEYVLKITEDENERPDLGRAAKKEYSVPVDRRKKKADKIVIYKTL